MHTRTTQLLTALHPIAVTPSVLPATEIVLHSLVVNLRRKNSMFAMDSQRLARMVLVSPTITIETVGRALWDDLNEALASAADWVLPHCNVAI